AVASPSWMIPSRVARGSVALGLITPCATWTTREPDFASTMPQPQCRVPGSMPRTLIASVASGRRERLLVEVGVRVDVLDVVAVLERVQQLEHLLSLLAVDLDGVQRQEAGLA